MVKKKGSVVHDKKKRVELNLISAKFRGTNIIFSKKYVLVTILPPIFLLIKSKSKDVFFIWPKPLCSLY